MPAAPAQQLTPGEAVATRTITAYTLAPAELKKAEALEHAGVTLWLGSTAFTLAALVAMIALRFVPRVQRLAERISRWRLVQAAIVVPAVMLVLWLAELPLGIWGHHLALQYALSVQGWGAWLADRAKAEGLTLLLAVPLVWGFYELVRRRPRRWWLYCWLASLPIMAVLLFVAPVVIDPLFNRFEPLASSHPALTQQLQSLAHTAGLEIPQSRIYLMHASDKVTTYNAYVTGIGASKRIVVWDTTARDLTTPQVAFIFSHEMGHYVLHHTAWGLAYSALLTFFGLLLLQRIAEAALRHRGSHASGHSLTEWHSFPLLLLLASLITFLAEPAINGFGRWEERAADAYGLRTIARIDANSAQTVAQTFQLLGEKSYDLPHPSPIIVFWSYTHPPISQRISTALSHSPE